MSAAPVKAAHGERQRQALALIAKWEKAKTPWGAPELAAELGIAKQQAWSLMQSLSYSGRLVRGTRTVILTDTLVLADKSARAA